MKKRSIRNGIYGFHLLFLLIGIGMLVASLFTPWASGRAMLGMMTRTIYPYQQQTLQLVLFLPVFIVLIVSITSLYGLFSSSQLLPGFIVFIIGAGTVALGIYLWKMIESHQVYFLGIDSLKLARVQPDIGVFLIALGGIFLMLDGLTYLLLLVKKR